MTLNCKRNVNINKYICILVTTWITVNRHWLQTPTQSQKARAKILHWTNPKKNTTEWLASTRRITECWWMASWNCRPNRGPNQLHHPPVHRDGFHLAMNATNNAQIIVRSTMQMEHVCAIREEIMRVVILHLHVIQIIIVAHYLPRPTQTRLVRRDGIFMAINAYKFV